MTASPNLPSVSATLKQYGLRPNKSLGQNFLTDPTVLEKICSIAGVTDQDLVLEIGAGLGHLTAQLARLARQVVAVELDPRLIAPLEGALNPYPNVRVVQGDILQLDPGALAQEGDYLVVANIPYYITSRIIRNLLEADQKPKRMILTIQYEVAQRVCTRTGRLSLLALSVLMYGDPSLELRVPAGAFYPTPKVDSAVININLHQEPLLSGTLREDYFTLIKAGFLHKRKTLKNSLSKGLGWSPSQAEDLLSAASIDPQRRAETLSLEEWLEVSHRYDKKKPGNQFQ
jgi:16S rRNA (adenine1518-N6/adenine1519-N6)-dimethyltransferase